MIELDDAQITKAALELTSNPRCHVVRSELATWNEPHKICGGSLTYRSGKVEMAATCREPCDFVCGTAREFEKNICLIKAVVRVINLTANTPSHTGGIGRGEA